MEMYEYDRYGNVKYGLVMYDKVWYGGTRLPWYDEYGMVWLNTSTMVWYGKYGVEMYESDKVWYGDTLPPLMQNPDLHQRLTISARKLLVIVIVTKARWKTSKFIPETC